MIAEAEATHGRGDAEWERALGEIYANMVEMYLPTEMQNNPFALSNKNDADPQHIE